MHSNSNEMDSLFHNYYLVKTRIQSFFQSDFIIQTGHHLFTQDVEMVGISIFGSWVFTIYSVGRFIAFLAIRPFFVVIDAQQEHIFGVLSIIHYIISSILPSLYP